MLAAVVVTFALAGSLPDEGPRSPRAPALEVAKKKAGSKPKPKPKPKPGPVAIPIDVGLGPQLILPSPPLLFEQPAYTALTLSIAAVIDKKLIEQHRDRIPAEYRQMAQSVGSARIRPWWLLFVPDVIILSPDVIPGVTTTGMYGAIWRPFGLGIDLLSEPVRFNLHADLAAAGVFMHSQLRSWTLFVRPGLTLSAVLEVPLGETFLVSGGWASDLFVPQPLSEPPWAILPWETWLWHLGGPFVKLHVRIPYEVTL